MVMMCMVCAAKYGRLARLVPSEIMFFCTEPRTQLGSRITRVEVEHSQGASGVDSAQRLHTMSCRQRFTADNRNARFQG